MSSDIQPGDVVVCVDARRRLGFDCIAQSWSVDLHKNALYRVTGIVPTDLGPGLRLDGEPPHTCGCCYGATGWHPNRFRKIENDTAFDFREVMRAKQRERVE